MADGILVVVSGFSGAGKGTLMKKIPQEIQKEERVTYSHLKGDEENSSPHGSRLIDDS